MHICLPYSMVEPIRDVLYSTMHSEQAASDKRWTGLLTQQLQLADVELVADLGTADVTLRDIVHLKTGDVIPLNIAEKIKAAVDGIPVMECSYGVRNGVYALKIDKFTAAADAE
jgi:flagellar motor switch protein FliM